MMHRLRWFVMIVSVLAGSAAFGNWPQIVSSPGSNFDAGRSITVDPQGIVYVASEVTNAGSGVDITLSKYTRSGTLVWTRSWTTPGNKTDSVRSVVADAGGGIYVLGQIQQLGSFSDILLLKYKANGSLAWEQVVEGAPGNVDAPIGLALDATAFPIVFGVTQGSSSVPDFLTIRFNKSGQRQWSRIYASAGNAADIPKAIATDAFGGIVVTGTAWNDVTGYDYLTVKYSSTGALLWTRRIDNFQERDEEAIAVQCGTDGSVVVTGSTLTSTGRRDFLTVKYDAVGALQWRSRTQIDARDDVPTDLQVDVTGNVYIVGTSYLSSSDSDILTVKLSAAGVEQWRKTLGSQPAGSPDEATGIRVSDAGVVTVVGRFRKAVSDEAILYVVQKYSNAGAPQTKKTFALTAGTSAVPIAVGYDRAKSFIYVTGYAYNVATAGYDSFTVRN